MLIVCVQRINYTRLNRNRVTGHNNLGYYGIRLNFVITEYNNTVILGYYGIRLNFVITEYNNFLDITWHNVIIGDSVGSYPSFIRILVHCGYSC